MITRITLPFICIASLISPAEVVEADQTASILPDCELLDQQGRDIHLSDLFDKPLVIDFIYLDCGMANYCPLSTQNFRVAQSLLGRLGLQDRVRFLSVSFDPEMDTPARLAEVARSNEADPAHWLFASAQPQVLEPLARAIGLRIERKGGLIDHNLRVVVVGRGGALQKVLRGNNWTPQELTAEIKKATR
jgi:protein SCO1/2